MSFCSHTSCGAGRCSYAERMEADGFEDRLAAAERTDAVAEPQTTDVEDLIGACAAASVMLVSLRSYYIYYHKLGGKERDNAVVQSTDVALARIEAALQRRFESHTACTELLRSRLRSADERDAAQIADVVRRSGEDVAYWRQRAEEALAEADKRERGLAEVYDTLAAGLRNEVSQLRNALIAKEEECRRMGLLLGDKIKQFNVCEKVE